jgi:MFS family permease
MSATAACWALLVSMCIVMVSNGLQGTLLGLRATFEGFDTATTGFVMAGYFAGFAGGSLIATRLIQRVGHVRVFAALASLASIAPLIHVMFIDPYVWFGGRLLTGFSYAGIYVVCESWLNDRATNETRGKLLSVYMVLMIGGMGAGPLFMNFAHPTAVDLFILASVLVSIALVPILLAASPAPSVETPSKLGLLELYKLSPLGVSGTFVVGMSNGGLVGMAAVYSNSLGFSIAEISLLIPLIFLGSVTFQIPIGMLSDHFDRRLVLIFVTFAASVVPFVTISHGDYSIFPLMVTFFVFGGLSFPMYSLCLSHANDRLETTQMLAASSTLVLVAGVGAILGPPIASYCMTYIGNDGYLWYFVVIHLAVGMFALYRVTRRSSIPLEDQENMAFGPQMAAVAPAFTTDTYLEIADGYETTEEDNGDDNDSNKSEISGP